jgi:tRNA (guanine-N7-)-methyltransferase
LEPRRLFPRPVADVWLEIGFGGGEHLIQAATRHPDIGFIGCEPFVNGLAKALARIDELRLDNIRIHDGDAADVLDRLAPASLGRVYLLYPDPWPKRRHWKRRFVSASNLARLARVMRPGAELRFATDWADYAAWTLVHVRRHPAFRWDAERADDWRRPWDSWQGTRYEAKAVAEGRRPVYLTFRRTERA